MTDVIINGNVNITINGNINYYEFTKFINDAKDELLKILYNKRYNKGWGGFNGWSNMLSLYYSGEYKELRSHISQFNNCIGARDKAVKCLDIIINKESV